MNLPKKVTLREVVTRDGFQSLSNYVSTEIKCRIINGVLSAGVKEIEVTSFVSPKEIPQLGDAKKLISLLSSHEEGVSFVALVPNLRGAIDAINSGLTKLVVVVSASESHNQANVNRTINQSLTELDALFNLAKDFGVSVVGSVAVAFGCPYEGNVSMSNLSKVVEAYLSFGASSIILADTVGVANPVSVGTTLGYLKNKFLDGKFTLHFHNNRGTAMANLLAAMYSGITSFDTALGGIGGCPYVPSYSGNLATEDVVCMLESMNIKTGINLKKIIDVAKLLERELGHELPGRLIKQNTSDVF